jgi:hypothetical protein
MNTREKADRQISKKRQAGFIVTGNQRLTATRSGMPLSQDRSQALQNTCKYLIFI